MSLTKFREAYRLPRVKAFLRIPREGESSQDDIAFKILYGWHPRKNPGKVFSSFLDHPRVRTYEQYDGQFIKNGKLDYTTAAGAFQITETTWNGLCKKYGFKTFYPEDQELAAIALIHDRGALQHVIDGNVERAMYLCRHEWASLPDSPYEEQPSMERSRALKAYNTWLKVFEETPTVEIEPPTEEESDMGPFAPLAGFLIDVFSPLVKEKITKEIGRHSSDSGVAEQIADKLVTGAKDLTRIENPVQAVAEVMKDPVLVKQLESRVIDDLNKMAPILDKLASFDQQAWTAEELSRKAAAERSNVYGTEVGKVLATWAVGGLFGMIAILAALVLGQIIWTDDHKPMGELVTALTGMMMLAAGKATTVYDFFFGSSRSSSAKDVVISEISARKKE